MTSTEAEKPTGQPGETVGNRSIGEIAKERAAQRNSLAKADVFVFVKVAEKPIAPQATCIVKTIQEAGEQGIGRVQLVEVLKGVLTTRQPAERILNYYQKALIDAGLIKIVNPGREKPANAVVEATAETAAAA